MSHSPRRLGLSSLTYAMSLAAPVDITWLDAFTGAHFGLDLELCFPTERSPADLTYAVSTATTFLGLLHQQPNPNIQLPIDRNSSTIKQSPIHLFPAPRSNDQVNRLKAEIQMRQLLAGTLHVPGIHSQAERRVVAQLCVGLGSIGSGRTMKDQPVEMARVSFKRR